MVRSSLLSTDSSRMYVQKKKNHVHHVQKKKNQENRIEWEAEYEKTDEYQRNIRP